ncbi:hypothetical protein BKA83DRAFT_4127944 [Pisolithus microcarpus]|nr:hypothetical protein BKA83DRAFT_4127944 [Pisolithus microcarpus]
MSSNINPTSTPVISTRNHLLAMGIYLDDSSIYDRLQWVHEGHGHVLSFLPVAEDRPDGGAVPPDSSTAEDDPAGDESPQCPLSPQYAILSAIGPNNVWKEFLEVKPSFALSDPGLQPAASDLPIILQTLQKITENCVTPGYSLCHKLFKGLEGNSDDEGDSDGPTSDAFSMECWPLTKEKTHTELVALKSTHRILPLPAYDLARDLIKPSAYHHCLQDAIVEIHFTMSCWGIAKTKRDIYGGEIWLIRMLVPPTAPSSTGRKCHLPLHIEIEEGLTTKKLQMVWCSLNRIEIAEPTHPHMEIHALALVGFATTIYQARLVLPLVALPKYL